MKQSSLYFSSGTIGCLNYERQAIVRQAMDTTNESRIFEVSGLASKFGVLDSSKGIDEFARCHGMLGLSRADKPLLQTIADEEKWLAQTFGPFHERTFADEAVQRFVLTPKYGLSDLEDLSWWKYHIKMVNRLLTIKHILEKANTDSLYDYEVAVSSLITFQQSPLHDDGIIARWADDMTMIFRPIRKKDPVLKRVAYILAGTISEMLGNGIVISFSSPVEAKNTTLGYRIDEKRITVYTLAAIYYDLWEIVTSNRPIGICVNPLCGLPFEPRRKDQAYCSNSCRQAAYRARQANG